MSDQDDAVFCSMCNQVEENFSRIIECVNCCKSSHFKCLKIIGNAVQKAKKKPFFCSAVCAEIHSRNTNKQNGFEDVLKELRSLGTSLREVRQESAQTRLTLEQTRVQINAIADTNNQIEKSQAFLAEKFDELHTEFNTIKTELGVLSAENKNTRKEVADNYEQHKHLAEKVDDLEMELDVLRRQSLSRNVVILGLPILENEDLRVLVRNVGLAVGYDFPVDDILEARRLNGRNATASVPPVIATFKTNSTKEALFDHKRKHGVLLASTIGESFAASTKRITIRDELTAFGRELLQEAKNLQSDLGIKYIWPGRNGSILLRRYDGAKVEIIRKKLELKGLSKTSQKRKASSTSSPSGLPSAKK